MAFRNGNEHFTFQVFILFFHFLIFFCKIKYMSPGDVNYMYSIVLLSLPLKNIHQ